LYYYTPSHSIGCIGMRQIIWWFIWLEGQNRIKTIIVHKAHNGHLCFVVYLNVLLKLSQPGSKTLSKLRWVDLNTCTHHYQNYGMKGIPTGVLARYCTYSSPKNLTKPLSSPRIRLAKNFHSTAAYSTKQIPFPSIICVPNPHQKYPK